MYPAGHYLGMEKTGEITIGMLQGYGVYHLSKRDKKNKAFSDHSSELQWISSNNLGGK